MRKFKKNSDGHLTCTIAEMQGAKRCKRLAQGVYAHLAKNENGKYIAAAIDFSDSSMTEEIADAWITANETKLQSAFDEADVKHLPILKASAANRTLLAQINSGDSSGAVWDVTIVSAGFAAAKPHLYISPSALQSSVSVFEGSRVYSNLDADYFGHKLDSSKKTVREIVGFLKNCYVQGNDLRAQLHILPSQEQLKDDLKYLQANNQLDIFQLSIDGGCVTEGTKFVTEFNETVPIVTAFAGGDVDLVPRGAAGGKINRMVASLNTQGVTIMNIKQKMMVLFALVYPAVLASSNIDWLKVNENDLYSALYNADKAQGRFSLPQGFNDQTTPGLIDGLLTKFQGSQGETQEQKVARETAEALEKANAREKENAQDLKAALDTQQKEINELRKVACAGMLSTQLLESKLPEATQKVIAAKMSGKIFTPDELVSEIKAARDMIAPFSNPQSLKGFDQMDVHIGAEQIDKIQAGLDLMMACAGSTIQPLKAGSDEYNKIATIGNGKVEKFRSIKEAYILVTGDTNITGRYKATPRMLASLETTNWANILANTLNRQLVKDYSMLDLDTWRPFVDITSPKDFRPQTRVRYGGYGDLPVVAEGGAYLGVTSPTDETMNYTPTKKGGTEDVTLEMIKNDDVGAIVKIPTRMARGAAHTLHVFVFDFVKPSNSAVIYDGTALYTNTHVNYATTALAATPFEAARMRMMMQTDMSSGEQLGIKAGYICVPVALEKTAHDLTDLRYGQYYKEIEDWTHAQMVKTIVIPYWTDATDWCMIADRTAGVGLEIGFLDGQEMPELLVSDIPNVGSWFTNDKITYKIRHIYGGGVTDYRFFDGSVVAG